MNAKSNEQSDVWIVQDENGQPIHCASWPEACHEHINDALNEHGIEEAKSWKVLHYTKNGANLSQPAQAVDVGALTELAENWRVLSRITGNKYERESLSMCADKLTRALSGEKAGRVDVDWTADARKWGSALNDAGWEFLDVCPEKSPLLFNTCKTALRAAILKYAERVAADASPTLDKEPK